MRRFPVLALSALALAAVLSPGAAFAHGRVVAATPAEGATVERPRVVTLTFNEAMVPSSTAASIVMTSMPGMTDHPPMVIRNFQPGWSDENRTLTLTLRQPLRAGTYDVRWQGAAGDGHKVTGQVSFTVR